MHYSAVYSIRLFAPITPEQMVVGILPALVMKDANYSRGVCVCVCVCVCATPVQNTPLDAGRFYFPPVSSVLTVIPIFPKLQALVYDILPSTTAVFSYATGSRKLSANEQFFLLVLKQ